MAERDPDQGINATIRAFGYPGSLVAAYRQWVVLLRPQQATLGALVLAARGEATRFGDLAADAFAELGQTVGDIEAVLTGEFRYEKINYLMLMMVDPQVHFHVLPRYASAQIYEGVTFEDPGWPKAPVLAHATEIDAATRHALIGTLRAAWPTAGRAPT